MSCLLLAIRVLLSMLLGLAVCAGLLMFMASSVISNALDPDAYIETLAQADAYNRLYSEVLVDPALQEEVGDLFGNVGVEPDDVVPLLKMVAPPEYLRSQTESVIRSSVGYLGGDLEELEVYVDLGPPLDNFKNVLLDYIDRRVDTVPTVDLVGDLCSRDGAVRARERFLAVVQDLNSGNLPESLPSLASIQPACRELVFDQAAYPALTSPTLSTETREALAADSREMKEEFLDGNTLGFFKIGARVAIGPQLDQATRDTLDDADSDRRLDLIALIGEENSGQTEAELRRNMGEAREFMGWLVSVGRGLSLGLIVGGSALMALVFAFNWGHMMRWPGLALLIGAAATLALGRTLESQVPRGLGEAIVSGTVDTSDFPQSAADLGADLLVTYSQALFSGLTGFPLIVLLVGVGLFAGSFFISRVRPWVRWT